MIVHMNSDAKYFKWNAHWLSLMEPRYSQHVVVKWSTYSWSFGPVQEITLCLLYII